MWTNITNEIMLSYYNIQFKFLFQPSVTFENEGFLISNFWWFFNRIYIIAVKVFDTIKNISNILDNLMLVFGIFDTEWNARWVLYASLLHVFSWSLMMGHIISKGMIYKVYIIRFYHQAPKVLSYSNAPFFQTLLNLFLNQFN